MSVSTESSKYHTAFQLSTVNESVVSSSSARPISPHRKYGNMKIIFESDRFLITLGPDYACFIFAMILFGLLYFFTIRQIYQKEGREVLGIITIIGTVVQVLSYIAVAISNPGVITQADFENEATEQSGNIKRFCNICNLPMLPRSRHCSECDVCIKGYDHHCPWTSKCIGQHNLKRFYFFASFTPLFLVYCIIVIGLV